MKRALIALVVVAACSSPASADEFLDSVVGVEAHGCSLIPALGSGAILADELVVTSAHTVAGADELSVISSSGRSLPAVLVSFDPEKDLAVLRVDGLDHRPLELGKAVGGETGWVLAWNRDEGVHEIPMIVTKRILVSIEDIYVEDVVERGAIELDAMVVRGDSGAAVITETGAVVGLIYATSRSRTAGFALNETEIAAALDGVGTATVDSGRCT